MADKEIADLTAASALDGTELIHGVQSSNSRKITTQAIADLSNFHGAGVTLASDVASGLNWSAQADISSWDSQEFDTDALWDPCTPTRFTIPASLNGYYAIFTCGIYTTGNTSNNVTTLILRHMDACSAIKKMTYNNIEVSGTAHAVSSMMGPRLLVTGDYFYARGQTEADTNIGLTAQRTSMSIAIFK
jgi:hypothetical protein